MEQVLKFIYKSMRWFSVFCEKPQLFLLKVWNELPEFFRWVFMVAISLLLSTFDKFYSMILEKNHMFANITNKGLLDPKGQSIMSKPILEKTHMFANIVTKGFPSTKLESILEKRHILYKQKMLWMLDERGYW